MAHAAHRRLRSPDRTAGVGQSLSSSVKRAHAPNTLEVPLCCCPRPPRPRPRRARHALGVGAQQADQRLRRQRPRHPQLWRLHGRCLRRQRQPRLVGEVQRPPHGVHRTYWGSGISSAVRTAKADVAKNRVPWMSFKAPYSWAAMANGKGDAWARKLATQMRTVKGPVWVAVHHEPEGDGNIQTWKKMQARLAPIMRAKAPNLGYSIILMGYHELYGNAKYRLGKIWPKTKIDVAGFDIYEKYGTHGRTSGSSSPRTTSGTSTAGRSGPASPGAWPRLHSTTRPHARTTTGRRGSSGTMDRSGGIAFSYFNTNLHSQQNWKLSNSIKKNSFKRANAIRNQDALTLDPRHRTARHAQRRAVRSVQSPARSRTRDRGCPRCVPLRGGHPGRPRHPRRRLRPGPAARRGRGRPGDGPTKILRRR